MSCETKLVRVDGEVHGMILCSRGRGREREWKPCTHPRTYATHGGARRCAECNAELGPAARPEAEELTDA